MRKSTVNSLQSKAGEKKKAKKITQRRPDRVGAGAEHRHSEKRIGKS
jgi:hypothetical protein